METKKIKSVFLSALIVILASFSPFALAATVSQNVQVNIQDRIKLADAAITIRVTSLNNLVIRINAMQKISAGQKNGLAASLENEAAQLSALKTKIDADTDPVALASDIQSITKSYRIYLLVLPQATISSASDRVLTISDLMSALVVKIQTRISQLSGTDTSAMLSLVSDISAKLSDATSNTNSAVSETLSLKPDNGDKAIASSNAAALKDARNKIKTASGDLTSARSDFQTVAQDIKGKGAGANQ